MYLFRRAQSWPRPQVPIERPARAGSASTWVPPHLCCSSGGLPAVGTSASGGAVGLQPLQQPSWPTVACRAPLRRAATVLRVDVVAATSSSSVGDGRPVAARRAKKSTITSPRRCVETTSPSCLPERARRRIRLARLAPLPS
jgi:hypothetical protein